MSQRGGADGSRNGFTSAPFLFVSCGIRVTYAAREFLVVDKKLFGAAAVNTLHDDTVPQNKMREGDLPTVHCIVPAAGSGTRFGAEVPKAFVELREGSSLLLLVLQRIQSLHLNGFTVVLAPSAELESATKLLSSLGSRVLIECGGATRQASVQRGIEMLTERGARDDELVMIHDAARCVLPQGAALHLVAVASETGAATLALPITDAICRSQDGLMIGSHVSREGLWSIQTPQVFRFDLLREAHQRAAANGTNASDDSELVSKIQPVSIVRGSRTNLKVTYAEDLQMAQALTGNLV